MRRVDLAVIRADGKTGAELPLNTDPGLRGLRILIVLVHQDRLNAGVQPILMDKNYKNPQSTQAGIGVERQLGAGFTVGADYSQVDTTHLQRNIDVNLPSPIIRANDPAQRPFFGLLSGT